MAGLDPVELEGTDAGEGAVEEGSIPTLPVRVERMVDGKVGTAPEKEHLSLLVEQFTQMG